jgi:hypothetical protein
VDKKKKKNKEWVLGQIRGTHQIQRDFLTMMMPMKLSGSGILEKLGK